MNSLKVIYIVHNFNFYADKYQYPEAKTKLIHEFLQNTFS